MSKEFFEALLETFAREAEAGVARIILLVLDNAGWHGAANLKITDGVRLAYLPPYTLTPDRYGPDASREMLRFFLGTPARPLAS